jgi:dinuclear metal center YbgI/SA1388 family protein
MRVRQITGFLESIAPLHLQEAYDNSGLVIGDPEMEVASCLVALDATPEVIEEAIEGGHGLVVAHHPIVFSGLKKINGKNYVERAVIKAIKNDIAIYAIHTNLDNVLVDGVNQEIANRLGLKNLEILKLKDSADSGIGSGIVGDLSSSMDVMDFLSLLKTQLNAKVIRHTKILDREIKRVGICGGSGSFLLESAIVADADIFVTGDFKYHEFFDADQKLVIADIGHYESEQFTIDLIARLISEKFSNFAAHCTKVVTNPIKYF